jgi:hypothetical protein
MREKETLKNNESDVYSCEIQWFPVLEEYDPGITTEKWLELLTDKSIIGGDYLLIEQAGTDETDNL